MSNRSPIREANKRGIADGEAGRPNSPPVYSQALLDALAGDPPASVILEAHDIHQDIIAYTYGYSAGQWTRERRQRRLQKGPVNR